MSFLSKIVGKRSQPLPKSVKPNQADVLASSKRGSDWAAASANNSFNVSLLKQLIADDEKLDNSFVSPFSILVALTLCANGATDETLAEMVTAVLGLPDQPVANLVSVNNAFKEIVASLVKGEANVEFAVANGVWSNDVRTEFKQLANEHFAAEARPIASKDDVNAWVSEATRGKITQLLSRDPQPTDTLLINAIYFKGAWRWPFDPSNTMSITFYPTKYGDRRHGHDVPMMAFDSDRDTTLRYYEDDRVQVCELPYGTEDGAYAAIIVLPRAKDYQTVFDAGEMYPSKKPKKTQLRELVRDTLTDSTWSTWMNGLRKCTGSLVMPRFELEYSIELSDVLKRMGMQRAFDRERAQFGRMSDRPGVFVGNVLHKTYVQVNEQGTEAAAVTACLALSGIAVRPPDPRFEMLCDHPFLFNICHMPSGLVVFSGVISRPNAA